MKRSSLIAGFLILFSSLASANEIPGDIIDQKDYDPNSPYFENLMPSWAVGFRFTFPNFPYILGHPAIYNLFAEKFLAYQQVGIFSAGIHFGTATFRFTQDFDGKEMLTAGVSLRYQLYLVKNQIIVPTVSFLYDNFRYGGQASNSMGPMFGGLLNLGFFDRASARQGHTSIELLRSYLSAEFRPQMKLTSSGTSFPVGNAWYFGVLLELE